MSLQSYINGERYGKEAYRLEREAMNDPFLQDAIDGYDQSNDRPAQDLKALKKQIAKRTKRNSNYLQLWGVAACVLLIVCLSIFFFLQDTGEKTEPFYVEQPVNTDVESFFNETVDHKDALIINRQQDNQRARAETSTSRSTNRNRLENDWYLEEQRKLEEEWKSDVERRLIEDQRADNYYPVIEESSSVYSLTDSEIQALFSSYERNERVTNSQQTRQIVREETLSEYVDKNRKQLTGNDCANQHGSVLLMFKVNAQGRPTDISVLRSLCAEADREAVRLLQNGPNLTPNSNFTRLEIAF